jgi:hypothetical protein
MKLELKHLAPYLQHGLKLTCNMLENPIVLSGLGTDTDTIKKLFIHHSKYTAWYPIEQFQPILRPLSDLKSHFDNYRSQIYSDFEFYIKCIKYGEMEHNEYDWLFENHYDVFGLIENNLAIDINNLTPPKH